MRRCDESLKKTLEIARNMLELADEGDRVREDAGCGVLYGVLRDSAFKLKQLAEAEKKLIKRRVGGSKITALSLEKRRKKWKRKF